MNGLPEIHTNGSFSIEKYQTRYTNKTLPIQVALGIIAVSGITLAVLSHHGCIDHIFMYVGTGGAITSALSAIGIFVFCRKNNLREALSDVRSADDLRLVCQNLEFHDLCCCHPAVLIGEGVYVNVTSPDIIGTVSHNEIETKINIFKQNTSTQEEEVYLNNLQKTIDEYYYGHKSAI
jgi:hypothetical protein